MKKQCTKCGRILNRSEFHKKEDSKDGLDYKCKECKSKNYKERNASLKWEIMMDLGGRCTYIENQSLLQMKNSLRFLVLKKRMRCSKNVFTDLKELDLAHAHNNGDEHRDLISNGKKGYYFYKALKDRNYDTNGYVVEIMCKSHHNTFDNSGKKNYQYKVGKFNDPNWLEKEYETKSLRKIAKECRESISLIYRRMIEFGIQRRKPGRRKNK